MSSPPALVLAAVRAGALIASASSAAARFASDVDHYLRKAEAMGLPASTAEALLAAEMKVMEASATVCWEDALAAAHQKVLYQARC